MKPGRAGLLLALGLGGCGSPPSAPASRLPVISLTLVAGPGTQTAFVTYGWRGDSLLPSPLLPIPVPAAEVSLRIVTPNQEQVPFRPGTTPGSHEASLPITPGATYRLTGTVAGIPVEGQTSVPASFEVVEPAPDTIAISDQSSLVRIPFRFNGNGVAFVITGAAGPDPPLIGVNRRVDTLVVYSPNPGSWEIRFYGLDQAGQDWLARANPRGNLSGVRGSINSAIVRQRVLLVR